MYAPTLAKRYPSVHVDPRELFVDDGDVLTSAGTAAGIDLCLHIVRTDHGNEAAGALARRLVVPPRRSGGQERYLDRSLPEEIGADPLAGGPARPLPPSAGVVPGGLPCRVPRSPSAGRQAGRRGGCGRGTGARTPAASGGAGPTAEPARCGDCRRIGCVAFRRGRGGE